MSKQLTKEERCSKWVFGNFTFRGQQCSRRGVIEEGGKLYCKQHAPANVKAKREALDKKWQAERQADDLRHRLVLLRRRITDEVLKAPMDKLPEPLGNLAVEYRRLNQEGPHAGRLGAGGA